jgi:hypothetical protein
MKVTSHPHQQFISGNPNDLAQELGLSGIMTILGIMCEAYKNLRVYRKVTPEMNEPEITEELFIELGLIWKKTNLPLIPLPEKPDRKGKIRGRAPTIDFCFRHRWYPNSYFGAECKILEEKNKKLYDLYIKEGVYRYLSGKYGENCSAGSMIGYVRIGNTAEIINEVKIRVIKLPENSEMRQADSIGRFTEHYQSVHERKVGRSPFHIHHLFFSFT